MTCNRSCVIAILHPTSVGLLDCNEEVARVMQRAQDSRQYRSQYNIQDKRRTTRRSGRRQLCQNIAVARRPVRPKTLRRATVPDFFLRRAIVSECCLTSRPQRLRRAILPGNFTDMLPRNRTSGQLYKNVALTRRPRRLRRSIVPEHCFSRPRTLPKCKSLQSGVRDSVAIRLASCYSSTTCQALFR